MCIILHLVLLTTKGWGVFTNENIRKGEYVLEYCGEALGNTSKELKKRENESSTTYLMRMNKSNYTLDARHKGSVARFINHCCTPNL